ncbi:MAG: LAGLIDADG family homing endonuclease [Thermoproteota archaeon]
MGGGSRIKQYERRFYEGEQTREKGEDEAFHVVRTFGKYEVREAKGGGYELLKSGEVIGIFSKAKIEEDRIVFQLSHGMNLEVSEKGIRELLTPEKAELCGLIASDGYIRRYREVKGKGAIYEVSLTTVDKELVDVFVKLSQEIYNITPHCYLKYHGTKEGKKEHYEVAIFSKKVVNDLWNLGIKGPRRYEFHPPLKHLDEEGMKAFLRGFFSGDGSVSVTEKGRYIRISSSCEECLREVREIFISLGFHPYEIYEDRENRHVFAIPKEEHLRFIEEIGSEKQKHISRFELIKQMEEKSREEKQQ